MIFMRTNHVCSVHILRYKCLKSMHLLKIQEDLSPIQHSMSFTTIKLFFLIYKLHRESRIQYLLLDKLFYIL